MIKKFERSEVAINMFVKISWQRIWRNKIKNLLTVFILLFPSLELLFYLYQIVIGGASVPIPDYAFFLTANSNDINHVFQSLFFWFMPLYCLVLTSDDCIEDYKIGYGNAMLSRVGKRNYIQTHIIKSFLYIFLLVASALLLNLLLVHLAFEGGNYNVYGEDFTVNAFYQWEKENPFITNLLFIGISAFFSGLISVLGTVSGILFRDKKFVYGITMLFWTVSILREKSLLLLFQPHSEYVLDTLIPIAVETGAVYILYIFIIYIKEVVFEKKMA